MSLHSALGMRTLRCLRGGYKLIYAEAVMCMELLHGGTTEK